MSRAFAAYWVIGCIISGAVIGGQLNRCPGDIIAIGQVAEMAATWPVAFGLALTANWDVMTVRNSACRATPPSALP